MSLSSRLKRLWDFIRLQLHMHFEEQSPVAAHCMRMHLGSIAEPRYNQNCTHKHSAPKVHPPVPAVRTQQTHSGNIFKGLTPRTRIGGFLSTQGRIALSSTCTQYRSHWSQEWTESLWDSSTPPPKCVTQSARCCDAGYLLTSFIKSCQLR